MSKMDIKQLVTLLENEKTWKDTNFYKKQLSQDNTEIVIDLINDLNTIINGKYPPMARLGAVRLLKSCLEAGQEYFNFMVQEGDFLDKLGDFAKVKTNTNIFSNKPDKREQQISLTLFTYVVEGFLIWAKWFPESKFSEIFEKLKKAKVAFPDISKLQVFKPEQQNLYINGIIQKKKQEDPSKIKSNATPSGAQTSGKPQAITVQQIEEKFEEYNTMLDLMVEMLGSMDQATDDLQMFSGSFNDFSVFADQVIQSGIQLNDRTQESLLDKSEIALNIHQLIEEFFTQKISFQEMKDAILEMCNPKQNKQDANQLRQQQQEQHDRELQEEQERIHQQELLLQQQQQQAQEQQRLKKEAEDRQRKEQIEREENDRKQKEQEEQLRRQQELEEQELALKAQEEEQKRKQAEKELLEKQARDNLENQRKQAELQKQQQQQEQQRILRLQQMQQEEEQHRRQIELEEEEEEEKKRLQLKKAQEEQSLRAIQLKKQKEQEEIARKQQEMEEQIRQQKQQEAQRDINKPSSSRDSMHSIKSDVTEERKSQSQRDTRTNNNKPNQPQYLFSGPDNSSALNQHGQGLYSNSHVNDNYNNNNTNQQKNSKLNGNPKNKEELMAFDLDDDIDQYDDPARKHQQKPSYPGQLTSSGQVQSLQQSQQPLTQNNIQERVQSNFPYQSANTSNKNPFNNPNGMARNSVTNYDNNEQNGYATAPTSNVKGTGNYFGEEEFYEPPQQQKQQKQQNQQFKSNITDSNNNNNRQQKVIFESFTNIDEDVNDRKASKISQKQINTGSRLDQSGNIDQDESFPNQPGTQIHKLNSTIAPKSKPQEENFRAPANPQLSSQINKSQNVAPQSIQHRNFPSGFEKVTFPQTSTLKEQVLSDMTQNSMGQNNQQQYYSNNQQKEQPQFSWGTEKQIPGDPLVELKQELLDLKRDKDINENKLQLENNKLSMKVRDLEIQISQKEEFDNQQIKALQQKQEELEKRVQEKDRLIFQYKQFIEQQTNELDQARSIAKQAEQQKSEQLQILAAKKKSIEDEHQKTRQQLQDYIDSTQKSYYAQLEQLQKRLNQSEIDLSRESAELQQRELENSDLRAELRLLRTKEPGINTGLIKDKDNKIQELKAKIDVLNGEITFREDKIRDLNNENLSLRKTVEDQRSEIANIESQIQISKENVIQRDIEIGQIKQTIFEKDQMISAKEQNIQALEQTIQKKKDIIEQFKGSAEQQMKKFHESIEESEALTKDLQRQKNDLEDRIESIQQQHQVDMNRIIQAGKLTEDDKNIYKQLIDEAEKLKIDKQGAIIREQNLQAQITQLQRNLNFLKKENQDQERNLEDLIMANNLTTKKLFERDQQFAKDQDQLQREIELKEKKYAAELKYTRQTVDTLKLEKQRKENDLGRSMDTLRKENELLLTNLKTKAFLSPNMATTKASMFSPIAQYESLGNEIDRGDNNNGNYNSLTNPYEAKFAGMQSKQVATSFNPILANTMVSPQRNSYDPRVGDELNSYNKNENTGSLNASTHSIKPRKAVPKNFLGKEIPYNNQYFSYLQTDKNQMYRFKKSCLKNKMAIYQDNYLNVGIITESKEIDGKIFLLLSVFFENKSLNVPLQSVSISYSGDNSIGVYKKPSTLPDYFKENSQHSQQIITEFNDIPYKIIQCSISYTFNGKTNQAIFPLPNTINKYFSPVPQATLSTISAAFSDFQHLTLCSEEIQVERNIASSQYDYLNYFQGFLNFGSVDGLTDYQCIAGQYFMKNINTNFWLKVNYNKKDHKAIFQVVYDNQLEDYSIATAKYLLQILTLIFKQ